jgi:hypothetical protein
MYLKTNLKLAFITAIGLAAGLSSCSDDDGDSKSLPTVETKPITNLTTISAVSGGDIKDDGGATVRFSGVAYSSTNEEPTIEDDTTRTTVSDGVFTATLELLTPSTTYYVRAYATSSIGTGYGEVVQFTTGNGIPNATNILIDGRAEVNAELIATYTYTDAENDPQGESTFQWYLADDAAGTGEEAIEGASSLTYTIQKLDEGKYLRIGITPKATAGALTGSEVKSGFIGAVGEATTVTFVYNGEEVTYGILNSPTTGRKWLDRNLGAGKIASSLTDYEAYGDLFQWGRLADGHQIIVRNGPTDADASGLNGTASFNPVEYSSSDVPGHSKFIPNQAYPADWRNPGNDLLWQGVNGINNPCPLGWRIPTSDDWTAEGLTTLTKAFDNLKLTLGGWRGTDATFSGAGSFGTYYSSSVGPETPGLISFLFITSDGNMVLTGDRVAGMNCRCIQD